MKQSQDVLRDDHSIHVEASLETQVIQNTGHEISITDRKTGCAHQRLIDDVLTKSGKRTGKVRCLECSAVIDDPYLSQK